MERLIIKIGGNMTADIKEVFENPRKAAKDVGTHTIYLRDSEQLYRILSPKRLELLRHIIKSQRERKTISELAHDLKRKQEAVSRDANFLAGHSLIKKVKEHREVYLRALYSSLDIRLAGS